MLTSFKNFIKDLTGNKSGATEPLFDAGDTRLAAAALMFHVIAADGIVRPEENERLHAILSSNYDISENEIDQLIEQARKADSEAIDLYSFTSVLKRKLSADERIALVEHLWEMVFADGELHEFEDNIVWRTAELIAVSQQDRISMKQRVLARQG
ncbi:MAG: TerB family tellurite resistance protein [Rhodobacteraceae bacterium]|nr:TerB family tellurite resistance protein [Paracoccaceae bacterium]